MKAFGDDALVESVLEDYTTAEIEPRLKTTLAFLQKLTLHPWELTASDVEPMRAAGLSDDAIEEVICTCMAFSIIDRIADAFDFKVADPKQLRLNEFFLLKFGYGDALIPG